MTMPPGRNKSIVANCPTCGYSMDGLRTRRCPECGNFAKPEMRERPNPLPRFAITVLCVTAVLPPSLAGLFFLLRQVMQGDAWILNWIIASVMAMSINLIAVAFASWSMTRLGLQEPGRFFSKWGRPRFMWYARLIGVTSLTLTVLVFYCLLRLMG
jgi:hypothetical protein